MPKRETAPVGAPCWVDILTSDADGARAFYGQLLGWTAEEPNPDFGGYWNFQKDGVRVAGAMPNDGQGAPDMWTVYFAVEDAKATVDAVAEHGGVVYMPAMDIADLGVMGVFADPDGATFGIWQPGLHKGFGVLAEPGAPSWFELFTRQHATAMKFYEDVLGWDTHVAGDTDEFRYSTLGKDEDALAGVMDASGFLPEDVPAHWSVYFSVDDVDASVAQATTLGATVVMPAEDTPYGRLTQLLDPTGTSFKLMGPNNA